LDSSPTTQEASAPNPISALEDGDVSSLGSRGEESLRERFDLRATTKNQCEGILWRVIFRIFEGKVELAEGAAVEAATAIRGAIRERGQARIVAATGASQLEFLEALTATIGIAWQKVELFHLDEYIGIPVSLPASRRLRRSLAHSHHTHGESLCAHSPLRPCHFLLRIFHHNRQRVTF
jgi:hypothetical protein